MKVALLNGSSLDPVPPEESKDPQTRYVHIHEDGAIDVEQMKGWVGQASSLPGWDGF